MFSYRKPRINDLEVLYLFQATLFSFIEIFAYKLVPHSGLHMECKQALEKTISLKKTSYYYT